MVVDGASVEQGPAQLGGSLATISCSGAFSTLGPVLEYRAPPEYQVDLVG